MQHSSGDISLNGSSALSSHSALFNSNQSIEEVVPFSQILWRIPSQRYRGIGCQKYFNISSGADGGAVSVCVCVCVCVYTCITIDREIFAVKIFRRSPSTTKIKQAKYFLRRIIRIGLVPRVVLSTKIKQRKNLTGENFYQ